MLPATCSTVGTVALYMSAFNVFNILSSFWVLKLRAMLDFNVLTGISLEALHYVYIR